MSNHGKIIAVASLTVVGFVAYSATKIFIRNRAWKKAQEHIVAKNAKTCETENVSTTEEISDDSKSESVVEEIMRLIKDVDLNLGKSIHFTHNGI